MTTLERNELRAPTAQVPSADTVGPTATFDVTISDGKVKVVQIEGDGVELKGDGIHVRWFKFPWSTEAELTFNFEKKLALLGMQLGWLHAELNGGSELDLPFQCRPGGGSQTCVLSVTNNRRYRTYSFTFEVKHTAETSGVKTWDPKIYNEGPDGAPPPCPPDGAGSGR